MPDRTRQLEVSLRLKAARYLAGHQVTDGGRKKNKPRPVALSTEDLASRSPLAENGITSDKLQRVEQMTAHLWPSEVRLVSQALGFDIEALPLVGPEEDVMRAAELEQVLGEAVQDPRTSAAPDEPSRVARDRPGRDTGADAG